MHKYEVISTNVLIRHLKQKLYVTSSAVVTVLLPMISEVNYVY